YCSDPVGQRASVVERGAVSAKKESELFQVAEGALTVRGGPRRITHVAVDPAPEERIEVDRPAYVVVVGRAWAIGVPAIAAIPGIDSVEVAVDFVLPMREARRLQERVHDHLEEDPVVEPQAFAVNAGQPRSEPRLLARGEAIPDP